MKNIIRISVILFTCINSYLTAQISHPRILDKPEVVFVKGGTFEMGGDWINPIFYNDHRPIHSVTLSSFSIGKYQVTVGQYKKFCESVGRKMPDVPNWGWQDNHPIVNVSYYDAVSYCNWLGDQYGGDWRLPTEAEWEYAARGGNLSKGYIYSGSNDLESVGWCEDNAGGQTLRVGRKKPNELGIYDMCGNVWEWCRDWYDENYYTNSERNNPKGPSFGSSRVIRGGSWSCSPRICRLATRGCRPPSHTEDEFGFRVVLSK